MYVADFDQSLQSQKYVQHVDRPSGSGGGGCGGEKDGDCCTGPQTTTTPLNNASAAAATTKRRPTMSVWLVARASRTLRNVRVGPAYWDDARAAVVAAARRRSIVLLAPGRRPPCYSCGRPRGQGGGWGRV